jgi:hypothetical protein
MWQKFAIFGTNIAISSLGEYYGYDGKGNGKKEFS